MSEKEVKKDIKKEKMEEVREVKPKPAEKPKFDVLKEMEKRGIAPKDIENLLERLDKEMAEAAKAKAKEDEEMKLSVDEKISKAVKEAVTEALRQERRHDLPKTKEGSSVGKEGRFSVYV